ncbi:MAG TPA: four helix bundle protein [Thermomicrobiales bacterium]|nr:four helix bundle protein [Thermomicrobiales bacterium]
MTLIEEPAGEYRAVQDYTDLRVWQLGMDLAVALYDATKTFPADERFGLTSQLRRAGVSVPSNIAEGNARNSTADYLCFLRLSRGSLAEIKTQLFISKRLGHLPDEASALLLTKTEDLLRQLTALYTAIERSSARGGSIPA